MAAMVDKQEVIKMQKYYTNLDDFEDGSRPRKRDWPDLIFNGICLLVQGSVVCYLMWLVATQVW